MKKKEGVRDFGKTFFLVFIFYLFFVVVVIKPKRKLFLENRRHTFLDIEKFYKNEILDKLHLI